MSTLWLPSLDAKRINRELRQVDAHLFLAEHRDYFGRPYFEVRYHVGSEHAPVIVLDWREDDGTPKPLTSQLLSEVSRLHQQGPPNVEQITRRNEDLKKARNEEHLVHYEEMVKDMIPRMRGTKGIIMPRDKSAAGAAARRQAHRDSERHRGVR